MIRCIKRGCATEALDRLESVKMSAGNIPPTKSS